VLHSTTGVTVGFIKVKMRVGLKVYIGRREDVEVGVGVMV